MLEKIDGAQLNRPADSNSGVWEPVVILSSRISSFFTNLFPKEKIMIRKTAIAIILVVVVLLGSTTATALASQNALPGDALYSVKTAFEDLRINTSWDTVDEA
nr:hypothetical protein [candidate division Zixibacteria bacterium]NIR95676.1 hypothetical protein [Gammaproteobacteria bacterium]NIS49238.1 hypothetical protein [candidate division Zixibacteria bacterium]NIU17334.1 hypothetical protein [candidate division Zixibacteria bacterium]NIV09465.1 hypothetical protein [candidate division Zixibacteria bacterium]